MPTCIALSVWLFISGCQKTPTAAPGVKQQPSTGVFLKPEEIENMGIVTTPAKSILHSPEANGFATVLAHDSIASAVAELDTAAATQRQSRAALERTRRLAGTAGALPADTVEALKRQATVDQVALELSHRKLSSLLGQNLPWKNPIGSPQLRALASGDAKLIRISFPLGVNGEAAPGVLRLAPINASQYAPGIETHSVWSAPADASVPGRSYFAYLKSGKFAEGEHLLAWMPTGAAESGILVPESAAIIHGGKYWCYVEEQLGLFVRTELDPSAIAAGGYFVKHGITAGAKIVTVAAGQLLAREINPLTAAAD